MADREVASVSPGSLTSTGKSCSTAPSSGKRQAVPTDSSGWSLAARSASPESASRDQSRSARRAPSTVAWPRVVVASSSAIS